MKTFKHILTALIILAATTAVAQQPADYTETTNWLNAWKQVAGQQASPSWIMQQSDATARYWLSDDGNTLVIIREADFDDANEAHYDLEAEQGEGATRLWLSSEVAATDHTQLTASYTGTLSGMPATVEKAHLELDGTWYTALIVGKGACNLQVLAAVNDNLAQQLVNHMENNLAQTTASK